MRKFFGLNLDARKSNYTPTDATIIYLEKDRIKHKEYILKDSEFTVS